MEMRNNKIKIMAAFRERTKERGNEWIMKD
jgi:hypothetical protein